jgi:DnaJ family protein B protein 12
MEPDPGYTFEPMGKYSMDRSTWQRGVKYYVDQPEWEASNIWQSIPEEKKGKKDMAMYSQKIRVFETGIENDYINRLRQEVLNSFRHVDES